MVHMPTRQFHRIVNEELKAYRTLVVPRCTRLALGCRQRQRSRRNRHISHRPRNVRQQFLSPLFAFSFVGNPVFELAFSVAIILLLALCTSEVTTNAATTRADVPLAVLHLDRPAVRKQHGFKRLNFLVDAKPCPSQKTHCQTPSPSPSPPHMQASSCTGCESPAVAVAHRIPQTQSACLGTANNTQYTTRTGWRLATNNTDGMRVEEAEALYNCSPQPAVCGVRMSLYITTWSREQQTTRI
jgi:hypothetical protein